MQIKVFPNAGKLNEFAAGKFVEIGSQAIKKRGQFTVALAGGSTPKSLYQLLSSEMFRNKLDWSSVFFFFGDERNVLSDDEQSNYKMANKNLFQPLKIHPENIFRWHTEFEDPKAIAEDYETKIIDFFDLTENEFPDFDLILLGIGVDGHTASLFPDTKALEETEKITVENRVEKLNTWRYTFSFPAINKAENIIFLVTGVDKAETLKEILEGEFQPQKLPSQKVKPGNGDLFWLLDSEAAELLEIQNK